MSTYQHKNLSGSIFENDNKTEDGQPDLRGSCMINGVEFWVSAWHRESKGGQKYVGLQFTLKEQREAA